MTSANYLNRTFSLALAFGLTACASASAAPRRALLDELRTPAQSQAPVSRSRVSAAPATESAPLPISLVYENEWSGPSLGNGDRWTPDSYGNPDSYQSLDNEFILGYKIFANTSISGSAIFNFMPDRANDRQLQWKDPYLRLKQKNIIKSANWAFSADLRTYFPVAAKSLAADLNLGIRSSQSLEYKFTGSRWSLSAGTYVRWNSFGNNPAQKSKQNNWVAELTPEIAYKVSDEVGLKLSYNMVGQHKRGDAFKDWSSDGTSLRPQLSWDATDFLNISPFINLYPGGKVNAESTWLGMNMSITLI